MRRDQLHEALSGGYIDNYAWDLLQKSMTMEVEVLDSGILSRYQITFEGVSRSTFEDEALSPWERLELTELFVERAPEESGTEEWEIRMNFWDLASLAIRCKAVSIDGEALR